MIRLDRDHQRAQQAKVQQFVEAVWKRGRLELIDELVAADYVGHLSSLEPAVLGPDGVRTLVSSRRGAHPDLYIKIEDQIAEDDRVVTRWYATSAASPLAPQGPRRAGPCCAGITIVRLLAGKQVDEHTQYTGLPPSGRRPIRNRPPNRRAVRAALSG